ncbi:MAG: class I SAM-dependent methyltransferase [Patescibacteria group bacterium]
MNKETADNLLKIVHDNYNEIAADFNVTRKKEIWPEIIKFAENVNDSDRILDLGCGNGRLVETFKNKKIEYLGVDNSEELIKLARINYPTYKFIVSDILNLENIREIAEQKFDYVFCLATLQHLPSRELRIKVLREMKLLLSENGQIIISNWNMWAQKKYRCLIFKLFLKKIIGKNNLEFGDIIFPWKNSQGQAISERYYHAFRKPELYNLAKAAGLSQIIIKKDQYNYWLFLNQ